MHNGPLRALLGFYVVVLALLIADRALFHRRARAVAMGGALILTGVRLAGAGDDEHVDPEGGLREIPVGAWLAVVAPLPGLSVVASSVSSARRSDGDVPMPHAGDP